MRKDENKQKRGQGRKTPAQLVYLALLAAVTAVKSGVLGAAEHVARDVRSDGGRVEGFRLQAPAVELVFWKTARNVLSTTIYAPRQLVLGNCSPFSPTTLLPKKTTMTG